MLLHLAYPVHGRNVKPTWVDSLKENSFAIAEKWGFFDPTARLTPDLLQLVSKLKVNSIAEEKAEILKLTPNLLASTPEVLQDLTKTENDNPLTSQIIFRHLYFLTRATLVVADLNNPSLGETSQEVLYAHLMNIPIIGISYRPTVSPWMHSKVRSIIAPRNADDLVKAIIATVKTS